MLIDFQVENFLSFCNLSTLSMEKGKYLRKYSKTHVFEERDIKLLKNVNIFGANGSGKTNLIAALQHFVRLVLKPTNDIVDVLPYKPFKLDKDSHQKGTYFSIRFVTNDVTYHYSVRYNKEEILFEELAKILSSGKDEVYFKRGTEVEDSIIPSHLVEVFKEVRKNKLLLHEGQNRNDEVCIDIFKWFHSNIVFESTNKQLFKLIKDDKNKKNLFIELLQSADFNLIDIEVIEKAELIPDDIKKVMVMLNSEDSPLPKKLVSLEVYLVYKKYDEYGRVIGSEKIDFDLESKGIQKMMLVVLGLLNNLNKNRVILMDEFDSSLHLSLTKVLLEIINSDANTNQFILTTHNLNLLDANLRVDQIYLAEKDFLGRTDLFSLFDFNDINNVSRSNNKYLKYYLEGKFGAVPVTNAEIMKDSLRRF